MKGCMYGIKGGLRLSQGKDDYVFSLANNIPFNFPTTPRFYFCIAMILLTKGHLLLIRLYIEFVDAACYFQQQGVVRP